MNEWAARIMSVFPERGNKADLDQFIQEVSNDDLERMYFQKEFNEEAECRPTFEQVSQDRIIEEANKNIIVLKSLEAILNERMQGFNSFSSSVTKTRPHFEQFEHSDCTLKLALDSLFIYVEQEILQSKQNIFLGDLRRSLNEMRTDAQKRITDYQKEIAAAEKDVIVAEKKLAKSKEQYERSVEFKAKMESFELDILMNSSRLKKNSFVGGSGASSKTPGKEVEDSVAKYDREIKEDIRNLLRVIGNRDQVLSASRRAFQKLDKECKKAIYFTLRKVAEKEKESAMLHLEVAMKMESTVCSVDVDRDVDEFIQLNIAYENGGYGSGALELSSQALSLLGDLIPTSTDSSSICSGKSSSSESSTPRGSFSGAPSNIVTASPARSKSISSSTGSSGGGGSNYQFQTPTSKLFSLDSATANKPVLTASSEELSGYLAQIFYAGDRQMDKRDETEGEAAPTFSVGESNVLPTVSPVDISQTDLTSLSDLHHQHLFTQKQLLSEEKKQDEEHHQPAKTRMSNEYMNYKRKSLHSLGAATTDPSRALSPSPSPSSSSSHHHHVTKPNTSVESNSGVDASQSDNKAEHRRTRVMHNDVQYVVRAHDTPISEWLATNPPAVLVKAVDWIGRAVKSQGGRDLFIAELNQFRSRKVDVGSGFDALGAVLWTALSYCQSENDIHTAKVMMMLSQTFFRQIEPVVSPPENNTETVTSSSCSAPVVYELESLSDVAQRVTSQPEKDVEKEVADEEEDEDEDASIAKRGVAHRQYIKEKLTTHPIWQDGNYWEQALWQCAIEQLQTIPYEKAWYDMDRETRAMSVRRVHDVIFSQVMAITHSMLELGCSSEQSREFLYRMCVIHQLGESQRQQLLGHVLRSKI